MKEWGSVLGRSELGVDLRPSCTQVKMDTWETETPGSWYSSFAAGSKVSRPRPLSKDHAPNLHTQIPPSVDRLGQIWQNNTETTPCQIDP